MEMPPAGIQATATIDIRAYGFRGFFSTQHPHFVVTVFVREVLGVLREIESGAPIMSGDNEARLQIAVDRVPPDKRTHQRFRLLAQEPQIARMRRSKPAFEAGLFFAEARVNLSTVSTGSAET